MWRLNQLSSTVHTTCTRWLQHCTNPRTNQWGGHAECVMAAFAWEGDLLYEIILKQRCRQQGRVYLCVTVSEWLIMRQPELFTALHLKMITCCPCRWQLQWCTPPFCFDVCGQGRAVITRLDILKQSWGYHSKSKYIQCFLFTVSITSVQGFYLNDTMGLIYQRFACVKTRANLISPANKCANCAHKLRTVSI